LSVCDVIFSDEPSNAICQAGIWWSKRSLGEPVRETCR
jgi:hypothetical protein